MCNLFVLEQQLVANKNDDDVDDDDELSCWYASTIIIKTSDSYWRRY